MSGYKIIDHKKCSVCGNLMDIYNNHPNKVYCSSNCHMKAKKRLKMGLPIDHKFSIDKTLDEIFIDAITVVGDCWKYKGRSVRGGYKQIWDGYKYRMAHKFSYEKYNGPIPSGLLVRHKCDNPWCVNPQHLELGTYKDNSQDMVTRERSCKGEKHPLRKLTNKEVLEIRRLWSLGKYTYKSLSTMYNVYLTTIEKIVKYKTWRHI